MRLSYTILYVKDVAKSIEFYQKAFNLEHCFTHESGDYAELNTGETTLAFCNYRLAADILRRDSQEMESERCASRTQITFEPAHLNTAYEQAVSHGAKTLAEPETKPWQFEVAILEDPDGHIIELARRVVDE
ncbi:MAG: VOC family protein [Calditrichia bacterium]